MYIHVIALRMDSNADGLLRIKVGKKSIRKDQILDFVISREKITVCVSKNNTRIM